MSPKTESPVPEPQTPEWVRAAVFYQIFPERFARSATVPKPGISIYGARLPRITDIKGAT
jgi:hypothetical protein